MQPATSGHLSSCGFFKAHGYIQGFLVQIAYPLSVHYDSIAILMRRRNELAILEFHGSSPFGTRSASLFQRRNLDIPNHALQDGKTGYPALFRLQRGFQLLTVHLHPVVDLKHRFLSAHEGGADQDQKKLPFVALTAC